MSRISNNLGLTYWDQNGDLYDHLQLANNWIALDGHDHTTGKGKLIPSAGLESNSVSTAKIVDSAVTSVKIADGAITGTKFPDNVITNAKLADSAVTSNKLIDAAITTAKINDLAVNTLKLADAAVTGAKIAPNSIDGTKLQDGSVSTTKITDSAITTVKVADDAITQAKLIDNSVGTAEIIDGNVTRAKLSLDIEPVGEVIMWYRPNTLTAIPTGWIPCDGRSLTAPAHDFAGGGIISIPDLRNKFVLGADTTGTGSGVATPPSMGLVGGSHTRDMTHTHTSGVHTHTTPDHTHITANHTHTTPDHQHSIANHGHTLSVDSHGHTFQGGLLLHSRRNAPITADGLGNPLVFTDTSANARTFSLQSVYLAGFNAAPTGAFDDAFGVDPYTHSHTVNGSGILNTDQALAGTTSSAGAAATGGSGVGTTGSASAGTSGSAFTTTDDFRPGYVGLLFLIKVKAT